MLTRREWIGSVVGLCAAGICAAKEKVKDLTTPEGLASSLRGFILQNLPPVLVEDTKDWGGTKLVTRGLEWKDGVLQRQKSYKNHGKWRRITVAPVAPALTLDVRINDIQRAGKDRRTFTTFVAMDLRVEAEQQNWRNGVKGFNGHVKARCRVLLTLQCEVTTKLVKKKDALLPDVVFRMRVLKSDVGYDHLVTEHVAGVGGEMAEWIGDAGIGLMKVVRPSLDRNLLEKANVAIVKAADTKDVKLGLGSWFSK